MKIAVGLFYLECNTFNPDLVGREQFIFAEGQQVLPYLHVCDIFQEEGFELVPTIMASTLPAGRLKEDDFWFFANKILDTVRATPDLDGVFLHLHGSMEVENIGSGDLRLVKELRRIVGDSLPIGIALDAHANNDASLADYVNMMRGYHTIPHSDQPETEQAVARALVKFIREKRRIKPALTIVPAIISGEKGLSAVEPLKGLIEKAEAYEQMEGIESATVFMGDPWSDCPNSHLSVVVVPEREEYSEKARALSRELAQEMLDLRRQFDFEVPALRPPEALACALAFEGGQVFITDSGDNTTGGAVGEGTEMLRLITACPDLKGKKVLIAAIHDDAAFAACMQVEIGQPVSLTVGTGRDETSISTKISGVLKCRGKVLGYLNTDSDECGSCCTVSLGAVDVVISNAATSFITPGHFEAAGTPLDHYDILVIKQGYLFAQLRPFAKLAMMAVTKGATYQFIEELPYKHLMHPIFPFEDAHKIQPLANEN